MNLPLFPEFKPILELSEAHIHQYSEKLQPYSDFIFSNLWSWNLDASFKASELNGNLILYLRDTRSKDFFYTIHGTNEVNSSLNTIFHSSPQQIGEIYFAQVPEETAMLINQNEFLVSEDRDSFDYIYKTSDLFELNGKDYKAKRQLINQFSKKYPDAVFIQKVLTIDIKNEILDFLRIENRQRILIGYTPYSEYEMASIECFFQLPDTKNIIASMLYLENELIGFSIDELIFQNYALSHFFKVKIEYKGAYDILNTKTAKLLFDFGVTHWNWVEDLGLPGLRQAKLSYRPTHFLKKYTIHKR